MIKSALHIGRITALCSFSLFAFLNDVCLCCKSQQNKGVGQSLFMGVVEEIYGCLWGGEITLVLQDIFNCEHTAFAIGLESIQKVNSARIQKECTEPSLSIFLQYRNAVRKIRASPRLSKPL